MKDTIFITGGTGFLGTELSSQLADTIDSETRVFILVRAGSEEEAYHRLRQAWQHDPLLYGRIGTQFFPVTGDLTCKRLGISAEDARVLREEVTLVFHCGANVGFQEDERTLASVNAKGTALGYYGLETDTIRPSADGRGVLRTGDLGIIHENGHITLQGRKKEMIVTAYGKNISIPKIEEKLKSIPGVSEAVLIGENRPYCTALLWLEDGGAVSDAEFDAKLSAELDRQIRQMNGQLSHPEQIRAYRVISKPLSIQAGELTPNLKVKRANVEEHLKETIEEMYR